jgi:hypothetical protein
MGITTDKIMDALATEMNWKILRRNGTIYTFRNLANPAETFKVSTDSKTGTITSSYDEGVITEKIYRIAKQLWDEYLGL